MTLRKSRCFQQRTEEVKSVVLTFKLSPKLRIPPSLRLHPLFSLKSDKPIDPIGRNLPTNVIDPEGDEMLKDDAFKKSMKRSLIMS